MVQARGERTARVGPSRAAVGRLLGLLIAVIALGGVTFPALAKPKVTDDRLTIDLFAGTDQIGTPIGMAVDRQGRVFIIESHTHARPGDYDGPDTDRVKMLTDTDGDGRADEVTTFAKGFVRAVDVAVGPGGDVYVTSRYAIHRIQDFDFNGEPEKKERIIKLETEGNDPHDGLHGVSFDARGRMHFGFGENAGRDYTLIGTDGTELTGGGEGGSVYRCNRDGSNLRRLAIGFWNPTATATDAFGRLLVTDNDPDGSPPNRLLHIVPGGHYGFEYRYGRSGHHVFQAWDGGGVPGTLPMAQGVGEAATDMIIYGSAGSHSLPAKYRGRPIVASWADHRVEHFELSERGASIAAERRTLVQGGLRFRPVGVDAGPEGSLYVSDWIRGQYGVHGIGRIWRVRRKDEVEKERPNAARGAIQSGAPDEIDQRRYAWETHKREAKRLAATAGKNSRGMLRRMAEQPGGLRPIARAAALQALAEVGDDKMDYAAVVKDAEAPAALRGLAARLAVERGGEGAALAEWADADRYPPAVRAAALRGMRLKEHWETLLDHLGDGDPFIRTAAIHALSRASEDALLGLNPASLDDPAQRVGVLLALKRRHSIGPHEPSRRAEQQLGRFLDDPHPDVRFIALKWIADRKLDSYRPQLEAMLDEGDLTVRLYRAVLAAIARLDGRKPRQDPAPGRLLETITNSRAKPNLRRLALRLIDPGYKKLTLEKLRPLLHHDNAKLRLAAIRTLQRHPDAARFDVLARIAAAENRRTVERAEAVVGLASGNGAKEHPGLLIDLAVGGEPSLRKEALRALVGVELGELQRSTLRQLANDRPAFGDSVARVLGTEREPKPPSSDLDAWLKLVKGAGKPDPAAGRRVFFHPKIGTCATCHTVDGRGRRVGPDLSRIGRSNTRRSLLRSILRPNEAVAPGHRLWQVETKDGTVRLGMALRKGGHREVYRNAAGEEFLVKKGDLASVRELNRSLMPPDLPRGMTPAELRDLLAYLMQQR